MICNHLKVLYWKRNASWFMGFTPGTVMVCDFEPGGGFAGAPQVLTLAPVRNVAPNTPEPRPSEFPPPSPSVQYVVGGVKWGAYIYLHEGLYAAATSPVAQPQAGGTDKPHFRDPGSDHQTPDPDFQVD